MKRHLSIISLLLVVVMLLSACGKAPTSEEAPAEEAVAAAPVTVEEAIQEVVDEEFVVLETVAVATGDMTRYSTNDESQFDRTRTDELVVGQMIAVESGDPANTGDTPALAAIYDTFLRMDTTTGEILPNIITEWEYLDDTTLKIKVRDDVVFHNGVAMTIDDVVYTLQRLADSKIDTRAAAVYQMVDWDKSTVDGEYEMTIVLTQPLGAFLSYLTCTEAAVLCKEHMESAGDDAFWSNAVGSGPFKVESINSGESYVLTRNDDYWGNVPAFSKLTIRYYAEITAMYIDYQTGILDMIISATSQDVTRVVSGEATNTVCDLYPGLRCYPVVFNQQNEFTADPIVRQAICMAINVEDVVYAGYENLAVAADSVLPSGTNYRIETPYEYDPEAAHQLLLDNGYEDGDIHLLFGTNTNPTTEAMAEVIQAQLAEIGIELEIGVYDMTTHIQNATGANNNGVPVYDIATTVKPCLTLDPDQVFYSYFRYDISRVAMDAIEDEQFNDWLLTAKYSLDAEERAECYANAQTFLHDNYLRLPLADIKIAVIYRDYIENLTCIDGRVPFLADITFAY